MDSDLYDDCEFSCGVGNVGWWSGGKDGRMEDGYIGVMEYLGDGGSRLLHSIL